MPNAGATLVTGGTGALGAPLVRALVAQGGEVTLLTRSPEVARGTGARVVRGDILNGDALGLAAAEAARVREETTRVVHAAALTRFDAPLACARQTNVEGTGHVLAFAATCPRLEQFCAASTIYVAGRRRGTVFEEELEHDEGFVNAYEGSKFEAERLLREWMPRLPIAVCRLSTALGDARTGTVYRTAAIHHALRFLYNSLLPMVPGTAASPVDLIATDYAVDALCCLAGPGFTAGRTYHVCAADETMPLDGFLDLVIGAFVRCRPAWRKRAIEKPALVALETFELFRRSVEAVADPRLRAPAAVLGHFAPQLTFAKRFDDRGARAVLARAGIPRPAIRETVERTVEYLIGHDWRGAGDAAGAQVACE